MTATYAGQSTCSTLPSGRRTHQRTLDRMSGKECMLRCLGLGVAPFSVQDERLASRAEQEEEPELVPLYRMGRKAANHPGATLYLWHRLRWAAPPALRCRHDTALQRSRTIRHSRTLRSKLDAHMTYRGSSSPFSCDSRTCIGSGRAPLREHGPSFFSGSLLLLPAHGRRQRRTVARSFSRAYQHLCAPCMAIVPSCWI